MKFTRKQILKQSVSALTVTITSSLLVDLIFRNSKSLKEFLNHQFEIPDIILLNKKSIHDFDFIGLKYVPGFDEVPRVIFYCPVEYKTRTLIELKRDVAELEKYSKMYDIFRWDINKRYDWTLTPSPSIISKIRENGCVITEDLQLSLAFVYAYNFQLRKFLNSESLSEKIKKNTKLSVQNVFDGYHQVSGLKVCGIQYIDILL